MTDPIGPSDPNALPPMGGADLGPVPWEDADRFPTFWKRLGGMFSLLFANPMELVDRIPATEGLAPAWRFNILMAIPYLAFTMAIFGIMGTVFAFTPPDPNVPKALLPAIFGGEMVLIVLAVMAGMFVSGAILHAMLWLWGGTRQGRGLGQTIRLWGYVWGFVHLGLLIPCFGALAALAGLVYMALGLARIHRTDTWRAVCAMFTPILLCCAIYAVILVVVLGVASFSH